MPAAGARTSLSQSRAALIAAAIIYAVLLWALHATYLNDVWDYYGFIYEPLSLARAATGFVLVASIAAFMPLQWTRPSALVVNLLFGIVYVPTVVITLGLSAASLERYGLELVALALGMGFISFASRLGRSSASNRTVRIAPLLLFWGVGCVWLVIQYSSTMRFVGLDQMYAQRELGASTSLASGYLQTYFANVLSPALFALGLLRKNRFLLLMGLAGCLLIYMINAQKTVLLLPPAMVALHLAMRWRGAIWSSSFVILAALSAFASTALGLHLVGLRSYLLQDFLIFRMLAIPGLTFSQYSDVFQKWGYTWWSNVRGLDLLVEPPPNLVNDWLWPNLGRIIGDRVYDNLSLNANANIFAWDGVAAGGALGILTIGLAGALWVAFYDAATRRINPQTALLFTFPWAMSLTNGSLFTVMLSYGGLFWCAYVVFASRAPTSGRNNS